MVDSGSTISVSITDDDVRTVEKFDEYFGSLEGTYSRAGRIKEAMAFYRAIHEVANRSEDIPDPDTNPHGFRGYVRQSMYEWERRDAEQDV